MFTLEKIALEVKGKVVGDSSVQITSVDDIDEASDMAQARAMLESHADEFSALKVSGN